MEFQIEQLQSYLEKSPSCFHVGKTVCETLAAAGFMPLSEKDAWNLKAGGSYYVTRNGSSVLAFRIPTAQPKSALLWASHSDSPTFLIKENPQIAVGEQYTKLNVEKYGGMLMAPWFDRPLSIAGRVCVKTAHGMETRLVNGARDLALIPSLAIHMNREANDGMKYNVQNDLLPLFSQEIDAQGFRNWLSEETGVASEAILSHELFLYDRTPARVWGYRNEFFSAGKLDDLACVYTGLAGFVAADVTEETLPMLCVFDNEEVGSGSKQGAAGTFLKDVFARIVSGMRYDTETFYRMIAAGLMISADNAHALHPNHTEKSDPVQRPILNGGIVIKRSANQKYTTDAQTEAICKLLCEKSDVPYQIFVNRSDMVGGSTLGNLSTGQLSIPAADIGMAQLAMHSCYETIGAKDPSYFAAFAKTFFQSNPAAWAV